MVARESPFDTPLTIMDCLDLKPFQGQTFR